MMSPPHGLPTPLGTLVYRAGLAAESDVQEALAFAERHGRRLGEVLMQRGLVSERDLTNLLANQRGLASVSLADQTIDPGAASLLSEDECRTHVAIPFRFQDNRVVVAVADPTNQPTFDELDVIAGRTAVFVVASRTEIYAAIDAHFRDRVRAGDEPPAASTEPPSVDVLRVMPEPAQAFRVEPSAPVPTPASAPPQSPFVVERVAAPVAPEPVLEEVVRTPANAMLGETLSSRLRVDDASGDARAAEPEASTASEPTTIHGVLALGGETTPHPLTIPASEPAPAVRVDEAASDPEALAVRDPLGIDRPRDLDHDVRFRHVDLAVASVHPADDAPPAARPDGGDVRSSPAAPTDARGETASADPASDGDRQRERFRVVLHLDGGGSLDLDTFDDEARALAAAERLVRELADPLGWPRVGRIFLQPSRIVAIEVQEMRTHRGTAAGGERASGNGWTAAAPGDGLTR